MATYYRWRKSTIAYVEKTRSQSGDVILNGNTIYYTKNGDTKPTLNTVNGKYTLPYSKTYTADDFAYLDERYFGPTKTTTTIYYNKGRASLSLTGTRRMTLSCAEGFDIYYGGQVPGTSQGYVYSTSSSAYPNGGVQGAYYYDQRTTVTSPTAPTGLTYPNPITTPSAAISWTAATSATDYPVSLYEVSYSTNGGSSWTVAGTTAEVSYTFSITPGTTSITFRVRARDSNNQWGNYVTGTASQVLLVPTLTVPQMVMQGQSATISWSAIEGADSYTLQRKSSADADWTQVYSGANTTFSETVGTWTSLQYRVQAVFSGTPGGWATSDPIQIVSALALVISGQDGDLGTLVNDVPYSISSDQTSPTIDVTVEVNGGEYASFQATSGQTYKVGVLDLPTGTGSIVITASTTVSESPVTVTRTWTYSKTAQTFPNAGGLAQLTKEGAVIWPKTLDEAVRAAMTPWGGNLSTALNLLKNAALFNRTKQPKYSEVTVSMANVTEGQIVNIPRGGVMVPHYVGKLEYESGLNGAGRRLLVPVECYDNRAWDAGSVNTWTDSDLLEWENGDYKALFPSEIQTAMGTTTYYFTPGNGNNTVTTRSDAVFSLSATELGLSQTWFNVEGSALPIVNTLKIAYLNGNANTQWTRTPNTSAVTHAILLNTSGSVGNGACNYSAGARPCFTLPSTFSGTYYVDQNGGIHDAQEYTEAGDWLDVWGNAIPAVKIATGSYVGTGTSGQNNPTTLTFPFEPKLVLIGIASTTARIGIAMNPLVRMLHLYDDNTSSNDITSFLLHVTWSENTISYFSNGNYQEQFNQSGNTYYYIAIG